MKAKSALLSVVFCLIIAATAVAEGAFHFALTKSTPVADSAVPSPDEVRLWFTQVPQQNSVAVRIINPAGDLVGTSQPRMDQTDRKIVSVSVDRTLRTGGYTVSWRGIGEDGHVVRGEFGFTVSAQ